MKGILSWRVAETRCSASLSACRSLSMTHGPAIRKSGRPRPRVSPPTRTRWGMKERPRSRARPLNLLVAGAGGKAQGAHGQLDGGCARRIDAQSLAARARALPPELGRGPDKSLEERMRFEGSRLEFRVELAAQEPGMVADLHDLDIGPIRRLARQVESTAHQGLLILPVELVAVAMALGNLRLAVSLVSEGTGLELRLPRPQAHRPAQLVDPPQFPQLVDHAVRSGGVKLRAVGPFQAADVPGEFDHRALHPETNPEIGHFPGAGVFDRAEHAGDAALAKAARHEDSVHVFKRPRPLFSCQPFGFDPPEVHLQVVRQAGMRKSLIQTLVRVLKFHVLAHDADRDFTRRTADSLDQVRPGLHVSLGGLELDAPDDLFVEPLARQHQRHFVNAGHVLGGDDRLFRRSEEH